jgi:hypothetical protein
MADLIFNIAKGRLVQLAKNVDDGSPAASRLILNGWNRKTLAAADVTLTLDDTGNTYSVDITDQSWTPTADAVTDLLLAYDADNAAGTDSDLVPLAWYDFAITPDGSQVTAQINASGAFSAS